MSEQLPSRVPEPFIVGTATLLPPDQVPESDPRLSFLDEGYCRLITHPSPGPSFVLWPDSSLGFAMFQAGDDEQTRALRLIEAYNEARQQLEELTQRT